MIRIRGTIKINGDLLMVVVFMGILSSIFFEQLGIDLKVVANCTLIDEYLFGFC